MLEINSREMGRGKEKNIKSVARELLQCGIQSLRQL